MPFPAWELHREKNSTLGEIYLICSTPHIVCPIAGRLCPATRRRDNKGRGARMGRRRWERGKERSEIEG
jgi:hypothetical protein